MMSYSVLMPVYAGSNPAYLKVSVDSILAQTLPTDDFVVICDGPVGPEIEEVLFSYGKQLRIVRGRKHVGLGRVLNAGLHFCKNDIIARMDDDDIAAPDRCEKEFTYLQEHPQAGIISSFVAEFTDNDLDRIKSVRMVPEEAKEIARFARHRNPFNHPAVMFRKEAVLKAGGYRPMEKHEDYYLWVRMLQAGVQGHNLQEPLVYMRASDEMFGRRGGMEHFRTALVFEKYLLQSGFISLPEYIRNLSERFLVEILIPDKIRAAVYRQLLRKIRR